MRSMAACIAAWPAISARLRTCSGRFSTPRGSRSRIHATAAAWSSSPICRRICRSCWIPFQGGWIARRSDMDKRAVPHQVRKVFEGRVFSVVVESITTRKGGKMEVEIVRHPGSVVLVPVTDAGEIVLVRQYRHAIGKSAWELPAGTLEPGEEPKTAAARECHEESGLVPSTLEALGSFFPTPGYCDEEMNFYKATGLRAPRGDETAKQDEDEDIEKQVFAVEQIRSMIRNGEIIDMK